MTEQTNREAIKEENMFEEEATPDNTPLFGDVDSDSEKETEQTETTDDAAEEETPAKPAGDKLKIKYMGVEEEIDLSDRENLVTLLQKGKNYDSKLEELETLKNSEELTFIRNMAKEAGLPDSKAFIQKVQTDLRNQRIQARAVELMDEGMSEEHALHTADLELKVTETKPQVEVAKEEEKPDVSGFVELLTEYPEAGKYKTLEEFPESVRSAIQNGVKPLVAFQKYENEKLKAEIEALKSKENAEERDMGSMRSAKTDQAKDPFLSGFMK